MNNYTSHICSHYSKKKANNNDDELDDNNTADPMYSGGYGYHYYAHFEKVAEDKFIMVIMVSGYVYELENNCTEVDTTETVDELKPHRGWLGTYYKRESKEVQGKKVICKPKSVDMESLENLLQYKFRALMGKVKRILAPRLGIKRIKK